MKYNDISKYKAYIFELDNVIYPEKDYLFQVYYLFTSFIEYIELFDAKVLTDLMVETYHNEGKDEVFNTVQQKFALDEKYRENFDRLLLTAKLPLKLLAYQAVLDLLQNVVINRKKIFIVTNGNPQQQLNKIRYTEWHGLEAYLTCYFAEETTPMPAPDVLQLLLKEHTLEERDVVMIGNSEASKHSAEVGGIDYYNADDILPT
ncbi:HAD hydrolase-like protein [Mucilaginibacter antarcticus]|uniref:HAD hydrolase-like protein n=1 Tax=Mucilaginibacter antarcticus TaxID=1855725 RepID=A0ABW5XUL0_9SPHI